MKKLLKLFAGLIILAFLAIQFLPFEAAISKGVNDNDLFSIEKSNDEISILVKSACYDCHSYQTKYPWYNKLAPVSWWLKDHIEHGRKHLNFSEWGTYSTKKKDHKLEECVEMLEEDEMPLWTYKLTHPEGRLNEDEKKALIEWFASLASEDIISH